MLAAIRRGHVMQDFYSMRDVVFNALIEVLERADSGTFYITTVENTSCRLGIENGQITHCVFQRLGGLSAVQALAQLEQARYAFHTSAAPFRLKDAVNFTEALQCLTLPLSHTLQDEPVKPDLPPPVTESLQKSHNHKLYRGRPVVEGDDEVLQAFKPAAKLVRYYRGQRLNQ